MNIEHTEVYGFDAAIRGMRNPLDSWDKSDSRFDQYEMLNNVSARNITMEGLVLGDKDKELSQRLAKAGGEHSKHLRLISVWFDVTIT